MPMRHVMRGNRWFVLAVLFLLVNTWGVVKWTSRPRAGVRYVAATFLPGENATLTGRTEAVSWEFSEAMVPAAALGPVADAAPVALSPAVPGVFAWERPDRLVFRPAGEWPECSRFTATLDRERRSLAGARMAPPASFSFRSAPLRLLRADQREFLPDGSVVLQLRFSAPVSPAALEHAMRLVSPGGEHIPFRVTGEATAADLLVRTGPVPRDEGELRIAAGLCSAAGPEPLETEVRRPIRFYSVLTLIDIEPVSRAFEKGYLEARFSGPVSVDRAAAFVDVQPATRLTVEQAHRWDGPRYRFYGDFRPGRTYTVTFRRGLPGEQGHALQEHVTRQVAFPDRPASLAFRAAGRYLSSAGRRAVTLSAVNVPRAGVTLREVLPENLVAFAMREHGRYHHFYGRPEDGLGRVLATGTVACVAEPNTEAAAAVRLDDLLGSRRSGAFRLTASVPKGPSADHFVVLTDLGLAAKVSHGEVLVWANSIRTLEPAAGAEIRVYSGENELLASGRTDADGLARVARPKGSEPFLVTARAGDDLSYVCLAGGPVGLGDTGGRPWLARGHEAFVHTDRGIYRPGETAHVRAVVRGPGGAAPEPFPVALRAVRPDGRTLLERTVVLSALGTAGFEVAWGETDPTGRYMLQLRVPGREAPIGQAAVALESFVPPRMTVAASADRERATAGETVRLTASARHLFGAPAGGLPASARVEFVPVDFEHDAWRGFVFRDGEKTFRNTWRNAGKGTTDAEGGALFNVGTDAAWRPPSAVKAVLGVTVNELGGRGVSAYTSCLVDCYPFYAGLKRETGGAARTGEPLRFEVAAVRPDGTPADADTLHVSFCLASWSSALRKEPDGRFVYRSERRLTPVHEADVVLRGGRGRHEFTPGIAGPCVLIVSDLRSGASASEPVYVGSPDAQWLASSLERPDRVELVLDKPSYRPGEEAVLAIRSPFAGRALVTVESDRVHVTRVVRMEKNTAEVRLPVEAAWAPNAWCAVSVIREVRAGDEIAAHRAAGAVPLVLDREAARLAVAVGAPEVCRPRAALEVRLDVRDAAGAGVEAEVAVAVVDEGICLLTGFRTPDPWSFFFGRRALAVALHDLYGELLPEADAAPSVGSAPGGGEAAVSLRGRLNPVRARRFRPLALWQGAVRTGPDGRAVCRFELPEFTGRVRVMAVAVDAARCGAGEAAVAVRRPLVVQSSLPRFLAPGDRCRLPVELFNRTGAGGEARVRVSTRGPLSVAAEPGAGAAVSLADGASARLGYDLEAASRAGVGIVRIEAELGGERYEEEFELAVRPAAPRIVRARTGTVAPGAAVRIELPSGWLPGTGAYRVLASGMPAVQLAGSLDYLLHYPYGCVEQTVSSTFPLLYLPELYAAARRGRRVLVDLEPMVRRGILQLLSMQTSSGAFAYWPNSRDAYPWGSLYATLFLLEAGKAGHEVPAERLAMALDYAASLLARNPPKAGDLASRAWRDDLCLRSYACLVLAAGGRPDPGWMARIEEQLDLGDFPVRLHLASAYAAAGRRRDALRLLEAWGPVALPPSPREVDGNLNSPTRSEALLLSAWLDLDPGAGIVPQLARRLEGARVEGRWHTTQENAMALMALGKYSRRRAAAAQPFTGTARRAGEPAARFDAKGGLDLAFDEPGDGGVVLENDGPGTMYYTWSAAGVPAEAAEAQEGDHLVRLRRRFLDAEGRPLEGRPVRQGEMLVVEWVLAAAGDPTSNLVVEDLLPAGLEIENANLKTSEAVPWARGKSTLPVRHVDGRDDRMIAFTGVFGGERRFFYAVRAVTQGRFAVPPALAEGMYQPEQRSLHGRGVLEVTP